MCRQHSSINPNLKIPSIVGPCKLRRHLSSLGNLQHKQNFACLHVREGNSAPKRHEQSSFYRHLLKNVYRPDFPLACRSPCTHIGRDEALTDAVVAKRSNRGFWLSFLFSFKKTPQKQEKASDSLKDVEKRQNSLPSYSPAGGVGSSLRQQATVVPQEVGQSVERGGGFTLKLQTHAEHCGSLRAQCETDTNT